MAELSPEMVAQLDRRVEEGMTMDQILEGFGADIEPLARKHAKSRWFLEMAPLEELRLELEAWGRLVPLKEIQTREVQKWRDGQKYDNRWLIICECEIVADNSAMFMTTANTLMRVCWPKLGATNFLRIYRSIAWKVLSVEDFANHCKALARHVLTAEKVPSDDIEKYLENFQVDRVNDLIEYGANDPLSNRVQRTWSSAVAVVSKDHKMHDAEFCSILNKQIRDFDSDRVGTKLAAEITRTINSEFNVLAVTNTQSEDNTAVAASVRFATEQVFPPGGVTFRGGRLPVEHRKFFKDKEAAAGDEKKYRAPMFLATSAKEAVALTFREKQEPASDRVLWRFRFPRGEFDDKAQLFRGCCVHVNKIVARAYTVAGENEWLFTPYSTFSVAEFVENPDGTAVVTLDVVPDNKLENEYLPLAPWH